MRTIEITGRFKRDFRREERTDPGVPELLESVINMLANDVSLPQNMADHPLSGSWRGYRDCHIKPDLVLIYAKREGVLSLVRLGSHSELFS